MALSADDRSRGGNRKLYLSGCPIGQEVTPECEIIFETDKDDLTTRYKDCTKHRGHENFIPVADFSVQDLPPDHQNPKLMDEIIRRCALTVRVKVPYTSLDRPDTYDDTNTPYPFSEFKGKHGVIRYGTGSVTQAFYQQASFQIKSCPCHLCKTSGKPKTEYWWLRVQTATHVIHDRSEAEQAEFDCFFDTDDRKGVKTIYGFDVFNAMSGSEKKYCNDVCDVLCVTHDLDTVKALSRIYPLLNYPHLPSLSTEYTPSRVIVSHPHGCSKKITIGNILHLTVVLGEDYPLDCEILFKNGTMYRRSSRAEHQELKNLRCDDTEQKINLSNEYASNDFELNQQHCNLKEKLDSIVKMASEMNTTTEKTVENCEALRDKKEGSVPRDKYLVDFYNLYLREHYLKIILICTILHLRLDRKRKGKRNLKTPMLMKLAFQEIFLYFLGKHLVLSDLDKEEGYSNAYLSQWPDSDLFSSDLLWSRLWEESDKQFAKFKSKDNSRSIESPPSIIVTWFAEVEKILDSVVLARQKMGQRIDEDILPALVAMGLKAGVRILTMHDKRRAEYEAKPQDWEEECVKEFDEKNGKYNEEGGDDYENDEEKDDAVYEKVPDGATFTLPLNADHAFRVYRDSPGWMTFPPGTIMNMPDGRREEIGYSSHEFKYHSTQPEHCYITYDINTCRGSSGANVFCGLMGEFLGTYFLHSGHVKDAINCSGIRDNFYTIFSKMFMFDPQIVLEKGCANGELRKEPNNLIEGCKLIMLNLKEILSKS